MLEFLWGWSKKDLIVSLLSEMSVHPAVSWLVPYWWGSEAENLPISLGSPNPSDPQPVSSDQPPMAWAPPSSCHLLRWWWHSPSSFATPPVLCVHWCSGTPSNNCTMYVYVARVSFLFFDSRRLSPRCPLFSKLWLPLLADLPDSVPTFSGRKISEPHICPLHHWLACPGNCRYLAHRLRRDVTQKNRFRFSFIPTTPECSLLGLPVTLSPPTPLGMSQGYNSVCLQKMGWLTSLPKLITGKLLFLHQVGSRLAFFQVDIELQNEVNNNSWLSLRVSYIPHTVLRA